MKVRTPRGEEAVRDTHVNTFQVAMHCASGAGQAMSDIYPLTYMFIVPTTA